MRDRDQGDRSIQVFDLFTILALIGALVLSLWGQFVEPEQQIRFLAASISLLITETVVERLFATKHLLGFTKEAKPLLRDLHRRNEALADATERYLLPHFKVGNGDENARTFQRLRLAWADRTVTVSDQGETFEVGRGNTIELWQDCLRKSRTWNALSFARDLWHPHEQKISDSYHELHRVLAGHDSIRRVFVVNGDDDLQATLPIIVEQAKDYGPNNVRWIDRAYLETLRGAQGLRAHLLRDLDFAVVNNSFVLEFILAERVLTGSRLTQQREIVDTARTLFDLAYHNGNRVEEGP